MDGKLSKAQENVLTEAYETQCEFGNFAVRYGERHSHIVPGSKATAEALVRRGLFELSGANWFPYRLTDAGRAAARDLLAADEDGVTEDTVKPKTVKALPTVRIKKEGSLLARRTWISFDDGTTWEPVVIENETHYAPPVDDKDAKIERLRAQVDTLRAVLHNIAINMPETEPPPEHLASVGYSAWVAGQLARSALARLEDDASLATRYHEDRADMSADVDLDEMP